MPGDDVEAGDVDRLRRVGRIDLRRDGGNLPRRDRDIAVGADVVAWIHDVPAAQRYVVARRLRAAGRNSDKQQQHRNESHLHRHRFSLRRRRSRPEGLRYASRLLRPTTNDQRPND